MIYNDTIILYTIFTITKTIQFVNDILVEYRNYLFVLCCVMLCYFVIIFIEEALHYYYDYYILSFSLFRNSNFERHHY